MTIEEVKGITIQLVKRFFIKLILRIKKNTVTATIQTKLPITIIDGFNPRIGSRCPVTSPLVRLTT